VREALTWLTASSESGLPPTRLCWVPTQHRPRWHRIARRHLRSRVMQRLVPLHQPWRVIALASLEATPVFLGRCQFPRRGFDPPRKPNDATTYTPCRATPCAPTFADTDDAEPRTFSVRHPPRHPLSRFRVLSADKSLSPRPCWRWNKTWGPPLVPWLSRRGPASDTRSLTSL